MIFKTEKIVKARDRSRSRRRKSMVNRIKNMPRMSFIMPESLS